VSKLHVSVLGQPRIEMDGKPVEINRRKAVALLTYLAVTGEPQTRDRLAGLFWPNESQDRARAALRRTLTAIRRAVGPEWIVAEGGSVGISRSPDLWLDVRQFDALLAKYREVEGRGDPTGTESLALLSEVARLYQTDFLSQFTLDGNTDFSEWRFFQGENLRRQFVAALARLVEGHARQGDWEIAVAYARRRLSLEPLDEESHRSLMRLYAASGHPGLALRQYRECERRLAKELGVQPDEATRSLHERIRTRREVEPVEPRRAGSTADGARQGRNAGTPRRRSVPGSILILAGSTLVLVAAAAVVLWLTVLRPVRVAVLPFAATSAGVALTDAMADSLIAELAGSRRVAVKSVLAVGGYRGTGRSAAEIGRELRVDWIVTGSVLVAGGSARIAVHLVRTRDDVTAWAGVYERGSADLLRVEREVAADAAAAMRDRLGLD
jgi:DNA-binding SARP family transcriptional activator/TolB-like protein